MHTTVLTLLTIHLTGFDTIISKSKLIKSPVLFITATYVQNLINPNTNAFPNVYGTLYREQEA